MKNARIKAAIAECERYIAKEGARSADLRPAWATQHLAFCKAHIIKLTAMLDVNS